MFIVIVVISAVALSAVFVVGPRRSNCSGTLCPHGRVSIKRGLVIYSKSAHDIIFEAVEDSH